VLADNVAALEKLVNRFLRDLSRGNQMVGVCLPNAKSRRLGKRRTRGGTFLIVGTPDGLVEVAKQQAGDLNACRLLMSSYFEAPQSRRSAPKWLWGAVDSTVDRRQRRAASFPRTEACLGHHAL